ncbi:fibronectin type III domain-containing protein [Candidatus Uhrbacteria bacterium]|nr:fibronectin type III domain-containing protein [Candidatus Uhrbacteria bacterium]
MTVRLGNILPLALIMMSMMLLAGIGIGVVVLEGSQRAKDTDESVSAYYMADSGVERQLYEIRRKDQTLAYVAALASEYPNASRWQSTAGLEQTMVKTFTTIPNREFAVVDLFDPDNLSAAAEIDELRITFGGTGQLELGYAFWTSGASVMWPSDESFIMQFGYAPSMTVSGLDPNKAYRIRLRAVNGDVHSVAIKAYRAGVQRPFPGDISLGAEGTYGKATQKIVVTMPKLNVLSGLYSYVVFSECQLLKGVEGAPVCP